MYNVTNTITATEIQPGDMFRDSMGHVHTAVRVERNVAGGACIYVYIEGQSYPEAYFPTDATEIVELAPVAPRPFFYYEKPKRRVECDSSINAISPKGARRKFWYKDADTMKAGLDRLIARGYEIIAYG